jgi:hypothetical protein
MIVFDNEFTRYMNDNKYYHEAGYDAYCTGLNLIRMLLYIGKSKGRIVKYKDSWDYIESNHGYNKN